MPVRAAGLAACIALATAASAQELSRQQATLVTKISATWCPPCGGWGWDLFEGILADDTPGAIPLVVHHSGDLNNAVADALADNLGITGQPQFYTDGTRQAATASTAADARAAIANRVRAAANTGDAPVAVGLARTSATELTARVAFDAATTVAHRVAVYAVEGGIVNYQASRGNDAVHERVLRGVVGAADAFGVEIVGSSGAAAGTEEVVTIPVQLEAAWTPDHLTLVAVVWRERAGGGYDFANAVELEDWRTVTSGLRAVAPESAGELRAVGLGDRLRVDLTLRAQAGRVTLSLRDAAGRVLRTQTREAGAGQMVRAEWSVSQLPAGAYVVQAVTDRGAAATTWVVLP